MKYAQLFKEWRVFSKLMALFITYELAETLQWVFTLDLATLSVQSAGLVTASLTAILGTLAMLIKFTYSFALHCPPKKE